MRPRGHDQLCGTLIIQALDSLEVEAYDTWQRLAQSEEFFLDMNFEEGDIQFLNNRSVMHSRTDYEDHPEVSRRRHLLRLWLRVPEWPARETNQIFMNDIDCRHWQEKNRRPFMDLPSKYLAELTQTQERRIREQAVLRPEATAGSYPSARGWQELPQPGSHPRSAGRPQRRGRHGNRGAGAPRRSCTIVATTETKMPARAAPDTRKDRPRIRIDVNL
jgi:hypothetical protein